jgi:hypothetical protein
MKAINKVPLQYLLFKCRYLMFAKLVVRIVPMSTNEFDIPEEINLHKQIWGKNPDEVIYGRGEVAEDDEEYRCPICISRIDEFGYCACGGNLGVS